MQVDTYSEAWRMACEARCVLAMPTKAERHAYLDLVEAKRGKAARAALAEAILAEWRQRNGGEA